MSSDASSVRPLTTPANCWYSNYYFKKSKRKTLSNAIVIVSHLSDAKQTSDVSNQLLIDRLLSLQLWIELELDLHITIESASESELQYIALELT